MTDSLPTTEQRRELLLALRACRPKERIFLRQLPRSRYAPYSAGKALGINDCMVWKLLNRPRVKHAMQLFLRDGLDEIGVSHTSLLADLVEIRDRCMQAKPVLDKKGKPTGAYQFDAQGAIGAVRLLMELTKLAPPKRIEVTGSLDMSVSATAARAVANRLEEVSDPNDAALQYQQLMYGKTTLEPPASVN